MSSLNVSTLSLEASDKREFRIIPAGSFSTQDGRPKPNSWKLTPEGAQRIVAAAAARHDDYLIDYEHASVKPGQPAPAAGWFKQLDARPDGVYITDARWNAAALRMIRSKEYRFISPVILSEATTGEVVAIHNVALTNSPALPGLTDLAALTANVFASMNTATALSEEAKHIAHLFGLSPADFARNGTTLAALSVTAQTARAALATAAGHIAHLFGHSLEDLATQVGAGETARPGFEGTGMSELRATSFLSMYGKPPAQLRAEYPNLKF